MAEKRRLTADKQPSISSETCKAAVQTLVLQYCTGHSPNEIFPEAVYIKHLPSYDEFFSNFLVRNQLCILSEEATRNWRSRREWVQQNGKPSIGFFLQMFGDATVPVANCSKTEFSAHVKQEMKMREFLAYWKQHQEVGNTDVNVLDSLYLKDWHFTRAFPDYEAYSTSGFFRSDWMNEFWDMREDIDDDYRFVYMGPKGTWTPFHADVFRSFSWSANICGRKKWIFYPPGEEEYLKDVHGSLVYDVTSDELRDRQKFTNAHKAKHRIEVIQNPGETVFVPSGWHHQVHNLDDTISINHNWLNGCNVRMCWGHLKAALTEVEKEISDCRDMDGWEQQCQLILRAYTGLDYVEFYCFMESVARRRQHTLEQWKNSAANMKHSLDSQITADREDITTGITQFAADTNLAKMLKEQCRCNGEATTPAVTFSGEVVCPCPGQQHDHTRSGSVSDGGNISAAGTSQCAISDVRECHCGVHHRRGEGSLETENNNRAVDKCQEKTDKASRTGERASTESSSDLDDSYEKLSKSLHSTIISNASGSESDKMLNLLLTDTIGREPHWAKCNVHHALFDLVSVGLVVQDMVKAIDVECLLPSEEAGAPKALLQSLSKTLHDFGVDESCILF